jgi:hypothetical protein
MPQTFFFFFDTNESLYKFIAKDTENATDFSFNEDGYLVGTIH